MHHPKKLALCRACHQFVKIEHVNGDCPHCGEHVLKAALRYVQSKKKVEDAIARVERTLGEYLNEVGA